MRPNLSLFLLLGMLAPRAASLAVNFFSMADGENHNQPLCVINGINDAVIPDADAIAVGMAKLLGAVGTRFIGQTQQAGLYAGAYGERKACELGLGAMNNRNPIDHGARLVFNFRSERNCLSGRVGSFKRFSAIARSIKSSRRLASWTMWRTTSSRTRRGNARKAVRNTSAVACAVVMRLV